MPDAANVTPPPAFRSPTGPLLLWLLVQLSALILAAGQVPLSAQYPQPGELLAGQVMTLVQMTAAAALMPWLMRDAATSIAVVATAWPFVVLSGVLSALSATTIWLIGGYVTAWLVSLAAANLALPERARHWGTAVALLISVGPLTLLYLGVEYAGTTAAWMEVFPSAALLRQLDRGRTSWVDWLIPAVVVAAAAGALRQRRGQVIHKSLTI